MPGAHKKDAPNLERLLLFFIDPEEPAAEGVVYPGLPEEDRLAHAVFRAPLLRGELNRGDRYSSLRCFRSPYPANPSGLRNTFY